jgi:hypothetical protein
MPAADLQWSEEVLETPYHSKKPEVPRDGRIPERKGASAGDRQPAQHSRRSLSVLTSPIRRLRRRNNVCLIQTELLALVACAPQPIRRLAIARPGTVLNLVHPDISPLAGQRKSLNLMAVAGGAWRGNKLCDSVRLEAGGAQNVADLNDSYIPVRTEEEY